jgi:DNA invertase Pin-like site-specific DNA recombinase
MQEYTFNGRLRKKSEAPNVLQLVELAHKRSAFVYQRLSTHEQLKKSLYSVAMQDSLEDMAIEDGYLPALTKKDVQAVRSAIEYLGYYINGQIIVEQRDLGISGTLGSDARRGLAHLINKIETDQVESIYVVHISRLFRDQTLIDGLSFGELCKKHNVVIVMPNMRLNLNDKMHMRIYRMELERAADELELMKMRMGGARQLKAKQGYYAAGSVPVGYVVDKDKANKTYDKYIVYEAHAEIVRQVFKCFPQEGFSAIKVTKRLRREGVVIPTFTPEYKYMETFSAVKKKRKTEGGYVITHRFVARTVTNPAYIGWWVWGGEVINKNNHPPIVEEPLFWYIQERLESKSSRKHDKYAEIFLLEDILYCSRHGTLVTVRCSHADRVYRCHGQYGITLEDSYCFGTRIKILDDPIGEFILSQCSYPEYAKQIVDYLQSGYDEAKVRAENAKREYLRIAKEIDKLKENLAYTKTQEQVVLIFQMVEERQRELKRLSEVDSYPVGRMVNAMSIDKVAGLLTNIKNIWRNQPSNFKNEFLRIILERIVLDADDKTIRVEVVWKTGLVQKIEIDRPISPARGSNRWTSKEIEIMKNHYPIASWEELGQRLPNRNYDAIMHCAQKLDIRRDKPVPRDKDWSLEEDRFLIARGAKDNTEVVQLASKLKRTALSTFRRLKHLNAYRSRFTGCRSASRVFWRITDAGHLNNDQLSR